MTHRILLVFAALLLVAAGCRGGDADAPATDDETTAESVPDGPPPPPPIPASEQLLGVWEHVSDVGGTEVRLGLTFSEGTLVRSTRGVATAQQVWSIVAESDQDVTADVTDVDGRVARHTWRIIAPGQLVHTATPELVYTRIGDAPAPEGSGEADDGSGAAAPE